MSEKEKNEQIEVQDVPVEMQDMSIFLPDNIEEAKEVKEVISSRFKDKKGNPVPFIFKAITTERINELEKECTRFEKVRGQGKVKKFDSTRFVERIAVETTVYPDFKSGELRRVYKTEDPIEVAKKVLSIGGEFQRWIELTQEVNGFGDDEEVLEEIAKN
ncbi:phage tail assembly chaperone [Halalkalibacterium halodurans]|uniref:Phage portal protein n=1 Tax=Halalkalibacterium halodurans TaxID=86665 RepID=A0A0M0KNC6_ALKHA|nr:phage portal protein [Halalkalibacterium halodurans]TES56189.1 phage portal protein [Halalkalibacterium halodurans]TPE70670.1 phage portal protein [Halalkalibacterium halodurans]